MPIFSATSDCFPDSKAWSFPTLLTLSATIRLPRGKQLRSGPSSWTFSVFTRESFPLASYRWMSVFCVCLFFKLSLKPLSFPEHSWFGFQTNEVWLVIMQKAFFEHPKAQVIGQGSGCVSKVSRDASASHPAHLFGWNPSNFFFLCLKSKMTR